MSTTNRVRFIGKVPSKAVKNLPPGIKREVLTADCADSTGRVWPKGTEFVALSGGFDNVAGDTYVNATVL
jgi:hypothetical protein